MASSSNHQPCLKKATPRNEEDRISGLPDSVLVHILSFLGTKYAVGTSILSTRWKNLWASVPNLEFCAWTLCHRLSRGLSRERDNVSFMNFIDRVLLFHELSRIQRFSLSCDPDIDQSRLNAWIRVAIQRHVQEIDFFLRGSVHLRLPRNLFTCKTLEVLKIRFNVQLDIPSSISFPCLRILDISLVSPSIELTQKLFSSCPVLEKLSIRAKIGSGKTTYNISSPALKTLSISLSAKQLENVETVVVVDAPILEDIYVEDNCLVQYRLKNISSLVNACVCVEAPSTQVPGATHLNKLFALLKAISNVKHLSLRSGTMAAIDIADDRDLPVFPILTHLDMNVRGNFVCKSMSDLLNSVPNLSTLKIEKVMYNISEWSEQFSWCEPRGLPRCLRSCLEEIKFCGTEGSQDELNLIKYFLEKAEVLNKMTLDHQEKEFLKKLHSFPRCSRTCKIEFI